MSTCEIALSKPVRQQYACNKGEIRAYSVEMSQVTSAVMTCFASVLGWGLAGAGVSWFLGAGVAGGAAIGAFYGLTQCW